MNLRLPVLLATCLLSANFLTGCALTKSEPMVTYDLGIPTPPSSGLLFSANISTAVPTQIGPLAVADVTASAWLDSQMMYYRLNYDNDQQPKPYANSRWSMPPPQLLGQRIKTRLAQNGGVVLSGSDGAVNIPLLRIEAQDFSQRFSNATQSDVRVAVRASLFSGRNLIAQKSFEQQRVAAPDAAGGARALAEATDAMISDMAVWLAVLPIKY